MRQGSLRIGLAFVAFGLSLSSATAEGLRGRWYADWAGPVACAMPPRGALTITRSWFAVGETRCEFASVAPPAYRGLWGEVQCRAPGDIDSTMRVAMEMGEAEDALRLGLNGGLLVDYRRCPSAD